MEKRIALTIATMFLLGTVVAGMYLTKKASDSAGGAAGKYALEKGLPIEVARQFNPLNSDGLQDIEKQAIDAVAALQPEKREKAVKVVMSDGKIDPFETTILKDAAYNPFIDYLWDNELTLLKLYEKDPTLAEMVVKTGFLLNGGLTSTEETYLLDPSKTNETNVVKELIKPYGPLAKAQLQKIKSLEVLDDITVYSPERLEYEIKQGHMDSLDFTGLNNLLTIYEPYQTPYAFLCLSGAKEIQDGINPEEQNIIDTEIIPGYAKLDGPLPEILNQLGGQILLNLAKDNAIDVSQYPKIVYGLALSHEPLMEIADSRITNFVLDQTYKKAKFGIENEKTLPWKLEEMPFSVVNDWAFPPMMEYGYFIETPVGEPLKVVHKKVERIDYNFLKSIYPNAEVLKGYKNIVQGFQRKDIENTGRQIIAQNYSEEGRDRPYFHFRLETIYDDAFSSAEELYNEYKKNGFARGDCTQNSLWITLLSDSVNIPSKLYHIIWSEGSNSHLDNGIFNGVDYWYHLGEIHGFDTVTVSPIIIEFDSQGNIENSPVLHLGNMDLSSISPNWFEEQIYRTWLKRWKK